MEGRSTERGAIHFHLIVNCWLYEKEVRKLWYKNLANLGCIPANLYLDKASKLTYFQLIEEIDFIGEKIGAYLESERDDDGKLIHKHDDKKRVRDIVGHAWGCSDNLRYKQLTVISPNAKVTEQVEKNALWSKEILTEAGVSVAFIYIFQQAQKNSFDNKWTKIKSQNPFEILHTLWHLYQAELVYEGKYDVLPDIRQCLKEQELGASWIASQLNMTLEQWHNN